MYYVTSSKAGEKSKVQIHIFCLYKHLTTIPFSKIKRRKKNKEKRETSFPKLFLPKKQKSNRKWIPTLQTEIIALNVC